MTREEIAKAVEERIHTGKTVWMTNREAFKDGAKWRINSVWHNAEYKRPESGRDILVLLRNGGYELTNAGTRFDLWRAVSQWAYVADLLPDRNKPFAYYNELNKTIDIGIKQKQEDMEEKELVEKLSEKVHNAWMEEKKAQGFTYGEKYDYVNKKHPVMLPYKELSEEVKEYDRVMVRAVLKAQQELRQDSDTKLNLKPFDLQKAKEGKPVCTRDGRKARIICFDRNGKQPIIALVAQDNEELIENYHLNGRFNVDAAFENNNDLMMLPEKKEGWINVYKERCYETREEAIRHIAPGTHYVDTIRVEWEE